MDSKAQIDFLQHRHCDTSVQVDVFPAIVQIPRTATNSLNAKNATIHNIINVILPSLG